MLAVSLKLAPVEGNKYDYGGPLLGVLIIFLNVVLYGPQFLKKTCKLENPTLSDLEAAAHTGGSPGQLCTF